MAKAASDRTAVDSKHPRHLLWWLGANATLRVARAHGWRGKRDRYFEDHIGRDWDDRSDELELDSKAAEAVAPVVEGLRREIAARNVRVAELPDRKSVRHYFEEYTFASLVIIDVDFGEFILPLSINGELRHHFAVASVPQVVAGMKDLILKTDAIREEVAVQELQFRNALEKWSNFTGAVPLWLRLSPLPFDCCPSKILNNVRETTILMLDENLESVMVDRVVGTLKKLHQHLDCHCAVQRRRASVRSSLESGRRVGLITEVALALINARGLDPGAVLTSLRVSREANCHDGILHSTETTLERLILVEGAVDATLEFKGGNYAAGKLTLDGDYPKTLAMAAKGRPLTEFVDHPAFRAAAVTVRQARTLRGKLSLYHQVQYKAVEMPHGRASVAQHD